MRRRGRNHIMSWSSRYSSTEAARKYDEQLLAAFQAHGWTECSYNVLCAAGYRRPATLHQLEDFLAASEYFYRGSGDTICLNEWAGMMFNLVHKSSVVHGSDMIILASAVVAQYGSIVRR